MDNFDEMMGGACDEEQKVKENMIFQFLSQNAGAYPEHATVLLKVQLEQLDKDALMNVLLEVPKKPTVGIILSVTVGSFGVDRFYAGDTKGGLIKLLTAGGCGVLTIMDYFRIMPFIRETNLKSIQDKIRHYSRGMTKTPKRIVNEVHAEETDPFVATPTNDERADPFAGCESLMKNGEDDPELNIYEDGFGGRYNNGGTYDHTTGARTSYYDDCD